VNPGGSGIPAALGFGAGGLLRSTTHCGGGGGRETLDIMNGAGMLFRRGICISRSRRHSCMHVVDIVS